MTTMNLFIYLFLPLLLQEEIPFKPADEFDFELKLEFRAKPSLDEQVESGHILYKLNSNKNDVALDNVQKYAGGDLPYAKMVIVPTRLSADEERIRIEDNLGNRIYNRKSVLNAPIEFDMGFTDDLKDHISPYKFDVIFFSKRKETSRIHLYFDKEGSLIINEEVRGKL